MYFIMRCNYLKISLKFRKIVENKQLKCLLLSHQIAECTLYIYLYIVTNYIMGAVTWNNIRGGIGENIKLDR